MVAIPVLIKPGLDKRHEESHENEDKDRKRLDTVETYVNKRRWKRQQRQKGENG